MKKFVGVVAVLLLAAGFAYAGGYEVQKKAGSYDVKVTIDRNPPIAGDNGVEIAVKSGGRSVTDAKVVVEYSMPGMPGMPPMNYKTNAALAGDTYKATMGLSMSGSWNITIKISRGGKMSSMKFTVDAK